MYGHRALVADLSRLTIVEKSYGYKLEAVRNESGHADLATALAIALPIAVERSGHPPFVVRSFYGPEPAPYGTLDSPLMREMRQLDLEDHLYRREMERLAIEHGAEYSEQEDFVSAMIRIGRL